MSGRGIWPFCGVIVRIAIAGCWLVVGTAPIIAQGRVYNPLKVQFAAPDHAITTQYTITFYVVGETSPVAEATFLPFVVRPSGDVTYPYEVRFMDLTPPIALPAGRDYVATIKASSPDGMSDPSVDSNVFRFNACGLEDGMGVGAVTVALLNEYTVPVPRDKPLFLLVTVSGPHPVTQVSIDLIGDGAPAWYFTVPDARLLDIGSAGGGGKDPYYIGPFRRPGTFILDVRARDTQGCEGTAGIGHILTVQ